MVQRKPFRQLGCFRSHANKEQLCRRGLCLCKEQRCSFSYGSPGAGSPALGWGAEGDPVPAPFGFPQAQSHPMGHVRLARVRYPSSANQTSAMRVSHRSTVCVSHKTAVCRPADAAAHTAHWSPVAPAGSARGRRLPQHWGSACHVPRPGLVLPVCGCDSGKSHPQLLSRLTRLQEPSPGCGRSLPGQGSTPGGDAHLVSSR